MAVGEGKRDRRGRTSALVLLGLTALLRGAFCTHSFHVPSEVVRTAEGRIRGVRQREGVDFVLGGLFPVHDSASESGGGRCGDVRVERGLERMEAMLFALDRINDDTDLLPGLTLGYDIRDTCNSENIGLDESIDLIITGNQDILSCASAGLPASSNVSNVPTSGLVGAASSRVSVPVASLARLFRTPQVSYASSSAILSNRDRYEYFYRTIPPDNNQAKAMVDVLLHFDWKYVSTIFSRNPYGEPGIVAFKQLAAISDICIDLDIGIEDDFIDSDFNDLAQRLSESKANVVILFSSQDNAEKLLTLVHNNPATSHRFTWIASDAWARSINTVHKFNDTAAGLFGFAPLTTHVEDFHMYFSNLTIDDNKRNPWFPEFYSAFAKCNLTSGSSNPCDLNAAVTSQPHYQQGNFIPLVIDAVYTYAHALHNFLVESCDIPIRWNRENLTCSGQKWELNGSALLEYIANSNFTSITNERIKFDSEGNVGGRYEILNYQAADDGDNGREFSFVMVGTWDSYLASKNLSALNLTEATPQFGINDSNATVYSTPISQCGYCGPGSYLRRVQSSCCGICEPCLGYNYSIDLLVGNCTRCPAEYWGNNPLEGSTHCVRIAESYLRFSNPWSVIIILVAIIGLLCVGFVSGVYAWFWTTPVVKSSGREQMVLLLVGIALSFVMAFIFVSPPLLAVCYIQRFGVWLCFSLMFGALLVKIVRVARIFLRQTTITRPRFTEPHYQIVFTFAIVLVQLLLVIASVSYQHPAVERSLRLNQTDNNNLPEVVVTCERESVVFVVLSVGYTTVIIIACLVLGILSFKYPENFNEARYVSFCTFCLLVIWLAFIASYFATRSTKEFGNAAVSLGIVMSAFAVLISLFAFKLYVMLFHPERNTTKLSTMHPKSEQQSHNTLQSFSTEQMQAITIDSQASSATPRSK